MDQINEKIKATVDARKKEDKEKVLQELRKIPIVQVASERASVSRGTYYRWRIEDKEFAKAADEAIDEGEKFISDMSETQIISLIRERNLSAITLWLRSHHPKYATKVEVTAQLKPNTEELTAEQQALVDKALRLASLIGEKADEAGEDNKKQ